MNKIFEECITNCAINLGKCLDVYYPSINEKYEGVYAVFSENNIVIHACYEFIKKGFLVWTEIPFDTKPYEKKHKFDILVYSKDNDTATCIEFKNNIFTPQLIERDIKRLKDMKNIKYNNLVKDFNKCKMNLDNISTVLYGVVTHLNKKAYSEWWESGTHDCPSGHRSDCYMNIKRYLIEADFRKAIDIPSQLDKSFGYIAYAFWKRDHK